MNVKAAVKRVNPRALGMDLYELKYERFLTLEVMKVYMQGSKCEPQFLWSDDESRMIILREFSGIVF